MKIERKTVRKAGGFGAGQAPDPLTLVVGSTEYKEEDSTITIPQPVQVVSDGTTDYFPDASGKVTIPGGGGGGVTDVELNGSSVVSGGVAEVNATTAVKMNNTTIPVDANGVIDLGSIGNAIPIEIIYCGQHYTANANGVCNIRAGVNGDSPRTYTNTRYLTFTGTNIDDLCKLIIMSNCGCCEGYITTTLSGYTQGGITYYVKTSKWTPIGSTDNGFTVYTLPTCAGHQYSFILIDLGQVYSSVSAVALWCSSNTVRSFANSFGSHWQTIQDVIDNLYPQSENFEYMRLFLQQLQTTPLQIDYRYCVETEVTWADNDYTNVIIVNRTHQHLTTQ